MPSRRKCAHTTKIERVPSYAAYHGEEDLDERLSNEGTLDLSMKKIKMEPPDVEIGLSTTGEGTGEGGESEAGNLEADANLENIAGSVVEEEQPDDSAPPSDDCETERQSGADDKSAGTKRGNHSSKQTSASEGSVDEQQIVVDSNGQPISPVTGLPLFPQTGKGKSARPFKLYTANRDILSGISTQGAPSLATYSVPVALTAVPGAVPLAFASLPLVSGVPMIPSSSPSSTTSATSSVASTGSGSISSSASSTSSTTTTVGAKTTSSTTDAHLMTLATEADKILRERHASEESSAGQGSDAEANTAEHFSSSSGGEDSSLLAGEVLKIPSLAGKTGNMDSLSFIQKRAVEAAQAAVNPPKNKKKRMTLPDTMKDIAYWERRRKNNEAAKRSRDARRAKEDQIAIRAALLEQENIRLKIEVTALKEETAKLRSMLYANNNS